MSLWWNCADFWRRYFKWLLDCNDYSVIFHKGMVGSGVLIISFFFSFFSFQSCFLTFYPCFLPFLFSSCISSHFSSSISFFWPSLLPPSFPFSSFLPVSVYYFSFLSSFPPAFPSLSALAQLQSLIPSLPLFFLSCILCLFHTSIHPFMLYMLSFSFL